LYLLAADLNAPGHVEQKYLSAIDTHIAKPILKDTLFVIFVSSKPARQNLWVHSRYLKTSQFSDDRLTELTYSYFLDTIFSGILNFMKNGIFTILTLISCNAVFSQTDDKGIVLGFERSVTDAFTKHNPVVLTSAYADNIRIITANGELISREQMIQSMQNVNSATVSEMQARIESNVAIITGIKTISGKTENGAFSNKLRFTDILLKTKGQWQIIASQSTAIEQ